MLNMESGSARIAPNAERRSVIIELTPENGPGVTLELNGAGVAALIQGVSRAAEQAGVLAPPQPAAAEG